MKGILADVGYADALLARELPDGRLMLVDGHLRAGVDAEQDVPVLVLDVTEAEADKLLLSLDPLSQLAESNTLALESLLRDVQTGNSELAGMWDQLAKDNGILDSDAGSEVSELKINPPPKMAWVLVGIPVVRYGEIQKYVEEIAAVQDITLLSTVNGSDEEN